MGFNKPVNARVVGLTGIDLTEARFNILLGPIAVEPLSVTIHGLQQRCIKSIHEEIGFFRASIMRGTIMGA